MRRGPRLIACSLAALGSLSPGQAASWASRERPDELIHSDLPLLGDKWEGKWPQNIRDGESIGCSTRVSDGDWKLERYAEYYGGPDWYRFRNYGAFHCFAVVGSAPEREALDRASEYSFFVLLGETEKSGDPLELWALQLGVRPGSDYILLSRAPDKGLITRFTVLQRHCPKQNLRDAGNLDTMFTRYCAINSREELVALARRMALHEPLGTLTYEGPHPE